MCYKSSELCNTSSIVKAFALYFKYVFVFSETNEILPTCFKRDVPQFVMPSIAPSQVLAELKQMNVYTSCGYDGLSAMFLVNCADAISVPLAALFNLSLQHGEFPDVLKYNNIIPIYKGLNVILKITEEYRLFQ